MKKILAILLALLISLSMFSACSASSEASDSAVGYSKPKEESANMSETGGYAGDSDYSVQVEDAFTSVSGSVSKPTSMSEKIIYSASIEIESLHFDESVGGVYMMLEKYGGFIESSHITGTDYAAEYYGYNPYRQAEFVVRIPVEYFETVKSEASSIGNVCSVSTYAENITSQYTDAQSRIKALEIEEERLLELLGQAESVDDMLQIEELLTEVRYEKESLISTVNNWDAQVAYSTLYINIYEVEEFTEKVEIQLTYWQQISNGFVNSLQSVGRFFKELFKGIIIALPVIAVIAVIVVVVVVIVLRSEKKRILEGKEPRQWTARRKEKKEARKKLRVQKKMQKNGAQHDDSTQNDEYIR